MTKKFLNAIIKLESREVLFADAVEVGTANTQKTHLPENTVL